MALGNAMSEVGRAELALAEKRTHLNFDAIFNDYADSVKRDWGGARNLTVGASEVYDCARKVWFTKHGESSGHKRNSDAGESWGAATRGNVMEAHYIVPAVRNNLPEGAQLLFAGEDQLTFVQDRNSATPDGLITGLKRHALKDYGIPDLGSDDACVVIEFKTIDPRVPLREARTKNIAQAQIQMGILRETTEYKPNHAIVLYVDASFFDKIKVFAFEFEPYIWEVAKRRAKAIFDPRATAKTTVPEGLLEKEKNCDHCEWSEECTLLIVGSIPDKTKSKKLPEDYEDAMNILIEAWHEADKNRKEADKTVEKYKLAIKELLEEVNMSSAKTELGTVSWYKMPGKKSLDKNALEEDGVDLEKYMKDGSPYDILRVSPS